MRVADVPLWRTEADVPFPVVTAYTLGDAARICGVSRRRLRYWERTALVPTRGTNEFQPAFDFRALVSVRSIVGLLARGVPLCRIRRNVEAVREHMPELEPLAALQLWDGSARFVIRHEGVLMEPQGQLVLDLGGAEPDGAVAPFERGKTDGNGQVTGRSS